MLDSTSLGASPCCLSSSSSQSPAFLAIYTKKLAYILPVFSHLSYSSSSSSSSASFLFLLIDTWKAIAVERVFSLPAHWRALSEMNAMKINVVCVYVCVHEKKRAMSTNVRGIEKKGDVNYSRARITLNDCHWSLLEWFCSGNREATVNHRYMMSFWKCELKGDSCQMISFDTQREMDCSVSYK